MIPVFDLVHHKHFDATLSHTRPYGQGRSGGLEAGQEDPKSERQWQPFGGYSHPHPFSQTLVDGLFQEVMAHQFAYAIAVPSAAEGARRQKQPA